MHVVVQLPQVPEKQPTEKDKRLRRLAMQIAVQLPEDEGDALDVLRIAKTLVRGS